jgi:chromate reductase
MLVMSGEAYVGFKPGLIDAGGAITDEGTRRFLRSFVERFATLVARFADPQRAAA